MLAVVAQSRREAEDALQTIVVEWTELPAITSMQAAIAPGAPVIHPDLGDNLCFTRTIDTGGVEEAFARAHAVVEQRFAFGRHTGEIATTARISLVRRLCLDNPNGLHRLHRIGIRTSHFIADIFTRAG